MTPLEHALDYARRGLPVLPCSPSGDNVKKPLVPRDKDAEGNPIPKTGGLAKATTDPDQIVAWWKKWPSALIGGAMGPAAGIFAIDPDVVKEPGDADGMAAWTALVDRHGGIPSTHAHETPSGGRHFVFALPDGVRITNKEGALKGTGINVRGDGGYLIMAPSRLADGREYRLADEFDFWTFAEAPAWLVDLITAEPEPEPKQSNGFDRHAHTSAGDDAALTRYVAAAVAKECDLVANCSRGGRNNQLNTSAFNLGTLVGANVLGASEATRRLYAAAEAAGLVKADGRHSVMATIESGLTSGAAKPRDMSKVRSRTRQSGPRAQAKRQDQDDDTTSAGPGDNVGLVTEDEGAILFAERHRGGLRYCWDHGCWFEWDGSIWRRNGTSRAFHYARELARQMAEGQDRKTETTARKAAFAGAVERFARADPAFAVTSETWDLDPMLLGTPGGTVELRTGSLRPARQEDGITRSVSVVPPDTAECPLWLKFLDETTGGDAGVVRFLQQWAGYSLTGDTREHALAFAYGPGGNGKSVFINVLTGILQAYAVTAAMETFIASQGEKHPTDLAMLRGARLVTASETEEGRSWAEARIKALTGGDDITARFMRQDFFTFRPTFKLTIIGNHKPTLNNVDDAARRRFNLIPFIRKPAVPDRQLEDKLKAEWPDILRWMIDGCLDWQTNGLVRPEAVQAATEAYFDEQDLISEWMEEKCIVDRHNTNRMATTQELFTSWTAYAKAANEPSGKEKAFAQKLEKEGFSRKAKVPSFGGGRARGFSGIELRSDPHQQRQAAE